MKLQLAILILLVFTTPVFAQTQNLQNGFDWLTSQGEDGNFKNFQATSIAALAFKEAGGFDRGDLSADYLLSVDNTCWPKGNCKVKDTALGLLALVAYSKNTDNTLTWFEQSQTPASAAGNWYLEVITSNKGICKISYDITSRDVPVVGGNFPTCQNSTFFDLNSCLEPGLLNKNPSIEFDVDCTNLGAGTKIAMVYQTGDSYYLISEAATTKTLLPVSNACYGDSAGSTCSVDPSLYSNWALEKANSKITVLPWLEDNYLKTNTLQTAIMYLSSGNADHLTSLKEMQSVDGSFDNEVLTTAFATLALKESGSVQQFDSAKAWLLTKQRQDGSFGDVFTTAAVLYAIYDGEPVTFKTISAGVAPACTIDGVCSTSFGENSLNCADDCFCGDNKCDDTESSSTCPADCGPLETTPTSFCGDNVCDFDEDNDSCPADCPSEGVGFWSILLILFIILLIAGAIYIYFKFYRGKPVEKPVKPGKKFKLEAGVKPVYKPPILTPKTIVRARKSRTELELEKSLEEAKKLLK